MILNMYNPEYFRETDKAKIKDFVKDHSFGILISHDGHIPQATHLPLLLEDEGDSLYFIGHFSKGNSHWKSIGNQEVLIIFPGPHTYISPSWYKEDGTVPTWNYLNVHVYGTCSIIQDEEKLLDILKRSVDFYEHPLQHAWKMEEHMDTVNKMINGVVGFRIKVNNIEAKSKLNQNHSKARQEKVIEALENSYNLYDSKEIAQKMKENLTD
jgi:transcriptional regulator